MMMRIWLFVVCVELLLISASALPGQDLSSSLRGTVVDPSGAAVANAPVSIAGLYAFGLELLVLPECGIGPCDVVRRRGRVGVNRPEHVALSISFRQTSASRWIDLGAILELYSGMPFNVITGADNNNNGVVSDRPVGVPRNSGNGPGHANPDINLSHTFLLGHHANEPENLRVGLSSFDVFNHPNDLSYTGVITSPFFGHDVAACPPRRMQVGAEFTF